MPFFVTKDPETGIQNMGAYRAQLKSPTRVGMNTSIENPRGGNIHWEKWRKLGKKMPCAIVIGGPPAVWYVAGTRLPEGVDEVWVAGALAGAPINVVKCRTVDLLVPADADIVVEGYVDNEYLEPEAPFGESHGHVNLQEYNNFVDVTAITRRRDAILMSYINQLAPSESSVRARALFEPRFLAHLKTQVGIKGITRVVAHEPLTGASRALFLLFDRSVTETEVWRALYAAASFQQSTGKIVIALSDDIDPENLDSVIWSMVFRSKPHLDVKVLENWNPGHGPRDIVRGDMDSALLINAVLKHDMAPLALPKREFMEHARDLWENKFKLGKLTPEAPWFGYSMGAWNEALDREADLAVKGEYWETGRRSAQRRRKGVPVNTEIRFVEDEKDGE
jgi:4-hydroxy-3-polyprenylbenzoate decarboxylase